MDTSISDLWWLKPEPTNGRLSQAFALGFQGAQRNKEREDVNRFRALQAASEAERINIAKTQWQSKTLTETMRGRGLSELNSFLATATAADKLADPSTEAEFFNLTSRWAPYIPQATVIAIHNNTFKAAKDRKAMSERLSRARGPAAVEADAAAAALETQAEELAETDPEASENLLKRAQGIRHAARLTPPQDLKIDEVEMPDGQKVFWYRDGNSIKTIKPPKDDMSDLERIEYTAELRALQSRYADDDDKRDEFDKQREALHRRFQDRRETRQGGPSFEDFQKWKASQTNVTPDNPLGLDLKR